VATSFDVIVIGAGHNGLVTAAYLAKAGRKVLVLERRPVIGGIVATEEVFPGFKFPTCAHLCGSFSRDIIDELELKKYGLELLELEPPVFAPLENDCLIMPRNPAQLAEQISRFSKADASQIDRFAVRIRAFTGFLRTLINAPLPDGTRSTALDVSELIKLGWRFHRFGEREMYEFLRVLPMSMADFLNEQFETEILKASLAAGGILGTSFGPRAQGTTYVFLHHQLGAATGIFPSVAFPRGGMGELPAAIARAAEHYGTTVRTNAEVQRIITNETDATGVLLQNGEELYAATVVSSADVKNTFLKLVEPTYLDPHFLLGVRNIKSRGTCAKVNLALERPPNFRGFAAGHSSDHLKSIIHIGPTLDYLERAADDAKYGRFSSHPFLQVLIPSLTDASLAPPGKHVMSVWMQYAPYRLKEGTWRDQRGVLGDRVVNLIDDYAPGFKDLILHRQVLTPLDLEEIFSLTEGHIYHAELSLDQIFFMRPISGWARYRTPIKNLYVCGSGTHPGGDVTGLPGRKAATQILNDLKQKQR
jgi:phytoene dehydrogenase-like protein